jgi:hypothetical protein
MSCIQFRDLWPVVKHDLSCGKMNATGAPGVPQVWRTAATSVARKNGEKIRKKARFGAGDF